MNEVREETEGTNHDEAGRDALGSKRGIEVRPGTVSGAAISGQYESEPSPRSRPLPLTGAVPLPRLVWKAGSPQVSAAA